MEPSPQQEVPPIRTNYHSHTARCQHAVGSDRDYVVSALEAGYGLMGFSDHCPWPFENGYVSGIRMLMSQLPSYLASARGLREAFGGQIEIPLGLEAEYYPEYMGWLTEMKEKEGLDYLLLGSHYDSPMEALYFGAISGRQDIARYVRHTVRGMRTGAYQALAHPELFMMNYPAFDDYCAKASREICAAARELDMPLEYNLSGFYPQSWRRGAGYPAPGFWEIAAREGCTAIIGLDAHDPRRYGDTGVYDRAVDYLSSLGIRRVDRLTTGTGGGKAAV